MDLSLDQIVRDNAKDDPQATADAVIAAVGLPKRWATLLRPALLQYCRMSMRQDASALEREYKWQPAPRPAAKGGSVPAARPITARDDFIRNRFATGDGRWVSWAEATVEDHEQRLGMLIAQRAGLDRTINLHQRAVEQILEAGVSCLCEVPEFDVDGFLGDAAA